jgi:hypothetical protein
MGLRMISGLPTDIKPYNSMYGTYGSDVRDEAMILETLTLLGQQQKASVWCVRAVPPNYRRIAGIARKLRLIHCCDSEYCGVNKSGGKLRSTTRQIAIRQMSIRLRTCGNRP